MADLRASLPPELRERAYGPGSREYPVLATGWNSFVRHRPDLVLRPRTPPQVQAAVVAAVRASATVRVQCTGMGALRPAGGGLLLRTGAMTGVRVDPHRRTASVRPGTTWRQLMVATQPFGLAGLAPPAPGIGVTGYALGGGAGWLARRYGLCSDTIDAAEIVTADGERRWIGPDREPELFAAVRGGMDNFGVVTGLRLRLVPLAEVFAGARYWPFDRAPEVAAAYRAWASTVPDEVTSSLAFVRFPVIASVPAPLRGRATVGVRACQVGGGPFPFGKLRAVPGELVDTFRRMPFQETGTITADSVVPVPHVGCSHAIGGLDDELLGRLLELATPGSPYGNVELRHAGGACGPATSAGLGYWGADFLLYAAAFAPDRAAARDALARRARLEAALAGRRKGRNLMTFLLPSGREPDDIDPIPEVFSTAHYRWLAAVKARYDPANLFGGDRNIPPAP